MKYLSRRYAPKSSWYPEDAQKRARVDEYMSWQHTGTRKSALGYFMVKVGYIYATVDLLFKEQPLNK